MAGESFDICRSYGWPWGSARSALLLSGLATKRGMPREARLWWGRAREAAETAGLATMAERAHGELDRLSEEPER